MQKHRVFTTHPDGSRTEAVELEKLPDDLVIKRNASDVLRVHSPGTQDITELSNAIDALIILLGLGDE